MICQSGVAGEAEGRVEVEKPPYQDPKIGTYQGYPYESRWPGKILFVLKYELAPISLKALALKLSLYEPAIPLKSIQHHIYKSEHRLKDTGTIAITEPGENRKFYILKTILQK